MRFILHALLFPLHETFTNVIQGVKRKTLGVEVSGRKMQNFDFGFVKKITFS